MSEQVVYEFEIIHIQIDKAERVIVARHPMDFAGADLMKTPAVDHAGKRIHDREFFQASVSFF